MGAARVTRIPLSRTCSVCHVTETRFFEHVETLMLKLTYLPPQLPPNAPLETVQVLKALNRASRALADLKGQARTIPNPGNFIDALALRAAKADTTMWAPCPGCRCREERIGAEIPPGGGFRVSRRACRLT